MNTVTVEPLGAITESVTLLARMVANSQRFRERCGVETEAAALDRVYYPWLDAPDHERLRPYALIEQGPDFTWEYRAGGQSNYLAPTGTLRLWLYDNARKTAMRDNFIDFGNYCDAVVQELVELAGKDGWLAIDNIRLTVPPMCSDPTKLPAIREYWGACFDCEWAPSRG